VILNPAAKGDKARRFRRSLNDLGADCSFKLTTCAGDARRLGAEAVIEDFDTIVAAGGDGTINEVLNGIGDVPRGFDRARLGIIPLGTVNVFARELNIPLRLSAAWATLRRGQEVRIDLPIAKFATANGTNARYFAQLAGAGLDARAIELVNWEHKKRVGPLAYIWAGLHALCGRPSTITVRIDGKTHSGQLVLVGNGKLYGGNYRIFPAANLRDGILEVCVFPQVNWLTLARCGLPLLARGTLPSSIATVYQAREFTLESDTVTPFEVDGELVGSLPAKLSIEQSRLRVVAGPVS
jgi:YegS/Rv2252/BmrU family lipid kinase